MIAWHGTRCGEERRKSEIYSSGLSASANATATALVDEVSSSRAHVQCIVGMNDRRLRLLSVSASATSSPHCWPELLPSTPCIPYITDIVIGMVIDTLKIMMAIMRWMIG